MKLTLPFCFSVFLLSSETMCAQRGKLNYAAGLRAGQAMGVTVQYFIHDEHVIEAFATTRSRGWTLTGLYEMHHQMADAKGFKWYYGAGAHAGTINANFIERSGVNASEKDFVYAGADGILGMEYFLRNVPVQFSFDWKPEYNFIGLEGWKKDNMAISARYRFQ